MYPRKLFVELINSYYVDEFGYNHPQIDASTDDLSEIGLAYTEFYSGDTEHDDENVASVQVNVNLYNNTMVYIVEHADNNPPTTHVEHYSDDELYGALSWLNFGDLIYEYI